MCCRNHQLQRVTTTQGVADVHKADQSCAIAEFGTEIVKIQFTCFGDPDMAQNTARSLSQELPGHQVAVVLHQREQDLIPFTQIGVTPAAGYEVDGLCGIAGEHNLLRTSRSDKGGGGGACRLKILGGPGTELVCTSMHIGVITGVVGLQRFENHPGFLARGGVIEIDQRVALRRSLIKNREIRTSPFR